MWKAKARTTIGKPGEIKRRRKVGVVRAPTERRLFKFSIFGFESLLQKSVFPNSSLPVTPWVSLNHICLTE